MVNNAYYEKLIIDAIDASGYGKDPETTKEKLQFLKDTFKAEYGWAIARMGEAKAFKEWLMGLPSSFGIPFENYEILKIAKESGSLRENASPKEEDKILENYWDFMTQQVFKLFRKNKIK